MRCLARMTPVATVLFVCLSIVFPQSADEVIEKYLAAIGGRAAIEKLQNRSMKASFSMPDMGVQTEMVFYVQPPDKTYSELDVPGFGMVTSGMNGDVAWSDNPMTGPRLLSGSEKEAALRQSSMDILVDWKRFFAEAELTGTEVVAGKNCQKVAFKSQSGSTVSLFFDGESGLMVRAVDTREGEVFITDFSDYQTVDGVKLPFSIRTSTPQFDFNMEITEVKHNIDIPDQRFALPAEIQRQAGQ